MYVIWVEYHYIKKQSFLSEDCFDKRNYKPIILNIGTLFKILVPIVVCSQYTCTASISIPLMVGLFSTLTMYYISAAAITANKVSLLCSNT